MPKKHWPRLFRLEWKNRIVKPEPERFAAMELQGLPAEMLDELHDAVIAFCKAEGLCAAFVNVGFVGTGRNARNAEGKMIPNPGDLGDLTFLGLASQVTAIENQMHLMLSRLLSEEQLSHASLDEMPMEEFEDGYGWLLDELRG